MRPIAGRAALWLVFMLVHVWLTYLGVVVVPAEAFHDVDLYRYWMYLGLHEGSWPVLDEPWVYPAGAVLPMLLPALVTTFSTPVFALAWCAMVTALDAVAVATLVRPVPARESGAEPAGPTRPDVVHERAGTAGAWWWLAFLALLGPVAVGRLDAVVAPLMVIALATARRTDQGMRLAAALLTFGAWVKVAPGALLLPLVAAARRPVRDVVLPAAVVCIVVVGTVTAGGGLARVLGFLTTQQGRGLQVESVAATPWVLAVLVRDDVVIRLNEALITYEVAGPGTPAAAAVLDAVLLVLVAAVAVALLGARRRGRADDALLPGALTLLLVLIVGNKVGSPQFLTWVAAPIAVLLTGPLRDAASSTRPSRMATAGPPGAVPRWLHVAGVLALVAAGLTQVVFPWGYMDLLTTGAGGGSVALVLAARNVCLLALLTCASVGLLQAVRRVDVPLGQPVAGTTS